MKIQHARTGLKLERRLYLRAQKHADDCNLSFAGYVTDLIAKDMIGLPDTDGIPDILRVRRLQLPPDHHARQKMDADLAHEAKMSAHPIGSPIRELREIRAKRRRKKSGEGQAA